MVQAWTEPCINKFFFLSVFKQFYEVSYKEKTLILLKRVKHS